MVLSADEATTKYKEGVKRIGGSDPYEDATECNTPECAAKILSDAKVTELTLKSMGNAYKAAYS